MATAKVQDQFDKKKNVSRLFVYLPKSETNRLGIQKGNIIEIELGNPHPEYIEPPIFKRIKNEE